MKLTVPPVGKEELAAVERVFQSGHLTQGVETQAFESLVAAFVGTKFAFATSSATTGLHLALDALGLAREDEVIMPAFSFPATANVAVQLGAIPVFVDVDIDTFNIDATQLPHALSAKSAAVMPVHAFGLPADMTAVCNFAALHGVPVIEDAACALGASVGARQAGSLGNVGVFSFHPRKIITTGEGGMITTDDEDLAERLRILRSHGGVRRELFLEFIGPGYNYRLSDVHAAIGVAQMARLEGILRERKRLAGDLTARLSEMDLVRVPIFPSGFSHAYQSYVVLLDDSVNRDRVIVEMRRRGIETTLGTYGMHIQPYFRDRFRLRAEMFPNATRAHRQTLTLPLFLGMSEDDLDRISTHLTASIQQSMR